MTYKDFKFQNDINRKNCQEEQIWHIDSPVFSTSKYCVISRGLQKETILVSKLVSVIMCGKDYVSNPSALFNYRFDLLTDGNKLLLYHGSPNAVLSPIFGKGEDKHDYGRGLYLTPDKELAKEWAVCNDTDGFLYKLEIDVENLKILNFDDLNPLHWVAELMSHRDADKSARYRKLAPLFIEKYKIDTSCYDIISGWRADSSYFSIVKNFVRDGLDASLLTKAFKLGDLGTQYCIKSKKAFDLLDRIYSPIEKVDKEIYLRKYNDRDSDAREKLIELLESEENTLSDVFSKYI